MQNLNFGLQLTMLGMGLVFAVLLLLWAVLALLLRLDRAAARPVTRANTATDSEAPLAAPRIAAMADGLNPDMLAAVTTAVLLHRAVRRKEAAPAMRSYWPGSLLFASRWVASGRAQQNRRWQRRG